MQPSIDALRAHAEMLTALITAHQNRSSSTPVSPEDEATLRRFQDFVAAKDLPADWSRIRADCPHKSLTDRKTQSIIKDREFLVEGYVLRKGEDLCISYASGVRWISAEGLFKVMHPDEYLPGDSAMARELVGFTVQDNGVDPRFTDEYNRKNRWSARRVEAPFCGPDNLRCWNAPTPEEALALGRAAIAKNKPVDWS